MTRTLLIASLVSVVGLPAYAACPDLTGKYRCEIQNSESVIDYQQEDSSAGMVYTVTGDDGTVNKYITDGQWYPVPPDQTQGLTDAQERATCTDGVLVLERKGTQQVANAVLWMTQKLSLKDSGDLSNATSTKVGPIPVPGMELVCPKI